MATIDNIITRAEEIRDETAIGANTATRVGSVMKDTADHVKDVETALNSMGDMPEITNAGGTDLDIADDDGNVLVRFSQGHIKTKHFDSQYLNSDIHDEVQAQIATEMDVSVVDAVSPSDLIITDTGGNDLAEFYDGHFRTKKFDSKNVMERLSGVEELTTPKTIYCVGDSITQGQTGIISPDDDTTQINRYPDILSSMLPTQTIINLGVGGQSPNEIFARMGWLDLLLGEDFTLPSGTSPVTAPHFVGSFDGLSADYLMQQGTTEAREQMSKCFINGVECELSFSASTLYINRKTASSKSTFFPQGTNVSFRGGAGAGIYLLYQGTNGTQTTDPDLYVSEIKSATDTIIGGRFLVLGLFTANESKKTEYNNCNEKMQKQFGSRYVDPKYIFSQQAFDDLGYTPTTDADISQDRYEHGVRSDEHQMSNGLTPSSFWRGSWTDNYMSVDSVHLNRIGYEAMARMFYNKLLALGWI